MNLTARAVQTSYRYDRAAARPVDPDAAPGFATSLARRSSRRIGWLTLT
jgi:hypothetical protein